MILLIEQDSIDHIYFQFKNSSMYSLQTLQELPMGFFCLPIGIGPSHQRRNVTTFFSLSLPLIPIRKEIPAVNLHQVPHRLDKRKRDRTYIARYLREANRRIGEREPVRRP